MANVIGVDNPKFQDRGYIYKKPTQKECRAMGWHIAYCPFDIITEFEQVRGAAEWIKETIWWQDFVLFPGGIVYFKYERDLVLFQLRWA